MSRGLRLIPIILLVWLVAGLAWRLIKPADPAIPSQLVERQVPPFELSAERRASLQTPVANPRPNALPASDSPALVSTA